MSRSTAGEAKKVPQHACRWNVCGFAHLRFESTRLAVNWHFACLCGDGCDVSPGALLEEFWR